MTKTVYLSGLKFINCELTKVSDKRELGCFLFLWASKRLTFQTKSKTTWIYDANRFILLGLRGYKKLFWNSGNSISRESPELHQTNSMQQTILSDLLVPCWFLFHSLHQAESMRRNCCQNLTPWNLTAPTSPVPNSYSPSPPPTPSAGFKPPRIEIPKWSGKNYDFYTWITACSRSFETTQCPEGIRTQLMTPAMPLEKNSSVQQHDQLDQFQ